MAMRQHLTASWTDAINSFEDYHSKLWKIARCLQNTPTLLPTLTTPTGAAFTPTEKAEALADAADVSPPESSDPQINEEATAFYDSIRGEEPPAENLPLATPKEIRQHILSLKPKKAPGPDGITAPLLRALPPKILVHLTMLINSCLLLCHFPSCWKSATTIFLHKPGKDSRLPSSYRPISLLNLLGKILEKVIAQRLGGITSDLNRIPSHQHGFMKGKGTVTQLHRVLDIIIAHLQNSRSVAMTSLDLTKAFDSVWHAGLIYKLNLLGYPKAMTKLLASYLSERTYQARVGTTYSPRRNSSFGVPQGSILGPKLIVIYTSDIPVPAHTVMTTYADDTATITASLQPARAIRHAQEALDSVVDYYAVWRLTNNAAKIQAMLIGKGSVRPPTQLNSNGQPIPWKRTLNYLGVTIDQRLSLKAHVDTAIRKATAARGALLPLIRMGSCLDPSLKLRLFVTCIRPILTYGVPAWMLYVAPSNWKRLQTIQNISVKHAIGLNRFSTVDAHASTKTRYLHDFCLDLYRRHMRRMEAHPDQDLQALLKGEFVAMKGYRRPGHLHHHLPP